MKISTWVLALELRQMSWGSQRVTLPQPDVQRELQRRGITDSTGEPTATGARMLRKYDEIREAERMRRRPDLRE